MLIALLLLQVVTTSAIGVLWQAPPKRDLCVLSVVDDGWSQEYILPSCVAAAQEGFIRCEDLPKNASFSLCNPAIIGHERKPDPCAPRWVVEYEVEGFRSDIRITGTLLNLCYSNFGDSRPCPHYVRVSDRFETKKEALEFALKQGRVADPKVYEIGACVPLEWETKTEEVKVKQTTGGWKVK